MNADAFDRFARSSARRGTRRAVLALLAVLPLAFARVRPASAQVCAPIGGLCTPNYGCCDGTPCPMNLTAWVGICLGAAATTPSTTTATQKTGRVPDDGNALGNRAKMRHRRRRRRDRKQKRRKKR